MKKLLPLFALLVASPAFAQGDVGVSAARNVWREAHNYVIRAAEQMPAEKYSYRPIATVRTFGELVGHVAGSQFMFCAALLGEKPRAEDAIEKAAKNKAALVQALKESADYCTKAYAMTDAAAAKSVTIFGQKNTLLGIMAMNAGHSYEHYGNIVTYLRMNGMVPPSSQPSR